MRLLATLLTLSLAVAPIAARAQDEPVVGAFVRVEGTRFLAGEEELRFVGANVAVMHSRQHREAMERTLDSVRADGLSVIRVWALGEQPDGAPEWARDYAFRIGEEGWIESSFAHLDRVLVAARERGLRVIVVLANRWSDYGGVPQYLRWAGVPFDATAPFGLSELELARFYDCTTCEQRYRAHARRVIERVNSISGIAYRDDPTILAWELANELSARRRDAASLVRWTRESARFVRSLDPRHLVSAGHIGYARASERATWLEVQRLPEIDFCDSHAYPIQQGTVRTPGELQRWIDDRVQLAHHVVGKPIVWGELVFTTRERRLLGVPRALWYDLFLTRSHRDGVEGALVWTYVPRSEHLGDHAIHPDGDEGDAADRTRDIRRVLARHAARWRVDPPRERNRALSPERGERPLFPMERHIRRARAPHASWRSAEGHRVLSIPARAFSEARFEAVGIWAEPPVPHLWGSGGGDVRFPVLLPRGRGVPARVVVRMRASSELPGHGSGATTDDVSYARVSLGDVELGEVVLPVDDGHGSDVSIELADPDALARLARVRGSSLDLRITIDGERGAAGLCVYGEDEVSAPRIRIEWWPAP